MSEFCRPMPPPRFLWSAGRKIWLRGPLSFVVGVPQFFGGRLAARGFISFFGVPEFLFWGPSCFAGWLACRKFFEEPFSFVGSPEFWLCAPLFCSWLGMRNFSSVVPFVWLTGPNFVFPSFFWCETVCSMIPPAFLWLTGLGCWVSFSPPDRA